MAGRPGMSSLRRRGTHLATMKGKSTWVGAYKCYQCRKPFTVKIGTIFESSHVPLRHLATGYLSAASSSKKGISSNQLERTFGVYSENRLVYFASHPRGDEKLAMRR